MGSIHARLAGVMKPLDPNWIAEVRKRLREWFQRAHRPLPWRATRDPYHIWVSEIMLQQTQTATVVPYYERFIQRFPTVQALAEAPLEEVLRYWEGLGYYARARNLHRAAQIVAQQGGELPREVERLRELPGIGAYTAGAIASLAFNQPEPVVDGNVTRVLARLLWLKGNLKALRAQRTLYELARQLVDPEEPGVFNQALMELGSTVCTPTQPRCTECPLQSLCAAYQRGEPTAVPEPIPARPSVQVVDVSALIWREGQLLLAQRPPSGLWGGLWEFPRATRNGCETLETVALRAAQKVGIYAEPVRLLGHVRHVVTYHSIRLYGYLCLFEGGAARSEEYVALRWVTPDAIDAYPLSAPQRRLARMLDSLTLLETVAQLPTQQMRQKEEVASE
ncbi:MAG: A/G-specific adenine glycosylase [Armatimonadota bacterium]